MTGDRTTTDGAVGMEVSEAGRNEPNTPAVAIDRLRADAARTGNHTLATVYAADLRSLITAYESQAERLREVEGAIGRFVEFNAYSAADPLAIRLVFENEEDRLAAANAIDALQSRPATENGK